MFYGWWIVIACALTSMYMGGVIFFGFTATFEPIADEFGWSYAQVSVAASLRGLEMGLLAPFAGLLVDRWGPRKLVFGGAIVIGLGLMLLSRVNSLGMFYTAFILIAIGMSVCSGTVMLSAVVNWFRRKASTVIGITVCGVAAGGLLVPLITLLIDTFGWRTAMVYFSLGTWIIVLPLSLLLRHKPEQYGYLLDGEASSAVVDEDLTSAQSTEVTISVKQALRSRTFWHINLAFICGATLLSAVVTHVMPYLSSIGVSRLAASLVASAVPVTSILGRLGSGWLSGRFDSRVVSATGFTLVSLGLLSFSCVAAGGIWLLLSFLVLFSIGWGSTVTMRGAMLIEYFGRSRFGTMYGFATGVAMLGQIAGAPLAGWVFDKWGSYQGIWFAFAAVAAVAAIVIFTTPQPALKSAFPLGQGPGKSPPSLFK